MDGIIYFCRSWKCQIENLLLVMSCEQFIDNYLKRICKASHQSSSANPSLDQRSFSPSLEAVSVPLERVSPIDS